MCINFQLLPLLLLLLLLRLRRRHCPVWRTDEMSPHIPAACASTAAVVAAARLLQSLPQDTESALYCMQHARAQLHVVWLKVACSAAMLLPRMLPRMLLLVPSRTPAGKVNASNFIMAQHVSQVIVRRKLVRTGASSVSEALGLCLQKEQQLFVPR
jgi:hypothetical protein